MTEIRRLTDSCVRVRTDDRAYLFDPGFHTFLDGGFDLETIGDVTHVLISHEHGDHMHPDFVRWILDRGEDVEVHSNQAVADLLAPHDIEVLVAPPERVVAEDVLHGRIPSGATPPNRSYTVDGLFTHPGDSREPTNSGTVLALPLMVPWDSATGAVDFARRVKPSQVIPIHDFYLSESGRSWVGGFVGSVLADAGIELVALDWGESYTI